jgi:hypothetical protein
MDCRAVSDLEFSKIAPNLKLGVDVLDFRLLILNAQDAENLKGILVSCILRDVVLVLLCSVRPDSVCDKCLVEASVARRALNILSFPGAPRRNCVLRDSSFE